MQGAVTVRVMRDVDLDQSTFGARQFCVAEVVLSIVGCSAAPGYLPTGSSSPSPPLVTTIRVSQHCPVPLLGQNHSRLRITGPMEMKVGGLWCVLEVESTGLTGRLDLRKWGEIKGHLEFCWAVMSIGCLLDPQWRCQASMQMCCSGVEQRGRLRAASLSAKEGGTDELASQHPVGESGKHTESDFEVVACVQFFMITRVNSPHCPSESIQKKFPGQAENTWF